LEILAMWKVTSIGLAAVVALSATVWLIAANGSGTEKGNIELLNVSYDPTRELYKELNEQFAQRYQQEKGVKVSVNVSHGGSGSQARAVIDGLKADVVTLALPSDTDQLQKRGLIAQEWESRLPNGSLPYYSTIVFVVRQGNPKGIKDWPDLVQDNLKIITPNPKTSGNGKLSFLAAWGSVMNSGKTEEAARQFVREVYERVPVLDTGARGSTVTFAQKRIGDVQLTWENEAHLELEEFPGQLEIVYPASSSIRAEPKVAWVDKVVDKKGTRAAAEAYLRFLYTDEAQEIIARHHYRPSNEAVLAKHAGRLKPIDLFPITAIARDWDDAHRKFFADGGVFDAIYQPRNSK
jgi:sulfate transport system substrate-binding protein